MLNNFAVEHFLLLKCKLLLKFDMKNTTIIIVY